VSLGIDDLSALRHSWGFAYKINATNGWWTAVKKNDPLICLEADSAEALNVKIRNDYYKR
jgi:hypothetical protein